MCKWQGHVLRWVMGGCVYGGIELLWRGHTHWTMVVLAALLCIPLDLCNEHLPWETPLWLQALLGGSVVTAAELAAGLVINVWLGLGVWDYSALPWNLWGQICPQYALAWMPLAGAGIVLFDWVDHWLCGGERPRYKLF